MTALAWALWFFVAVHLAVLDDVLTVHAWWAPSLAVSVALVFALHARATALPGLLFCLALPRATFLDGDLAVHFLALGVPVAALLPLRGVLYRGSVLWQCAVAGFLAVMVPRVGTFLARIADQRFPTEAADGVTELLCAVLLAPLVGALLRRIPPLSLFVERGE